MNYFDLVQQFPSKERRVQDIIRYLSTRVDDNSNYSLLLGAGCSITSGIRSATELIRLWRREILVNTEQGQQCLRMAESDQKAFLQSSQGDWYDPSREYSSLFERRYDLQRQRRMFVEKEVSGAFPSIGYAYLTSLVESGVFRTIFTTNFDDLLNEAFYLYSNERPIVCAQDSSISSVTVTSKRPKIIKLHGDYLFDDLKSTMRETESLQTNMRAKFMEFAKEAGLVVVGYSGNDRSIMDILTSLLKNEEFLKGGVYWCLREDSEVTEELRRLFWRDRIYFVKITGFDEFLGDVFSSQNNGDVLPPALLAVARPSKVVDKLLASPHGVPETTEPLRRAKRRLASLTTRSAIANLMVHADQSERPALRGQRQDFTDEELLVLTEVRSLVDDQKYEPAHQKIVTALRQECRPLYRRRLLEEQIKVHRLKGDHNSALLALDQLISLNPLRGSSYLLKASIELNEKERLRSIQRALELDQYLAQGHLDLARWHMRASTRAKYGELANTCKHSAIESLQRCLDLNPSRSNSAWTDLCSVLGHTLRHDKQEKRRRQDEILATLAKQGPETLHYLELKLTLAAERHDQTAIQQVIEVARRLETSRGLDAAPWIANLLFDALNSSGEKDAIAELVVRCESLGLLKQDPDLAYSAAVAIRKTLGDEVLAKRLLSEALREWDFDVDVFRTLLEQHIDLDEATEARRLYDSWAHQLAERPRLDLLMDIYEAEGKFEDAIAVLDKLEQLSGERPSFDISYLYLRAKKYREAEQAARLSLERCNFTPEATSETVNYELARKRNGKKVDPVRLENLLKFSDEPDLRAAVCALQDRREDMVKGLREAFKQDKRFRYTFLRWPVFADYLTDPDVRVAVGLA